jgi:NAD(P)-dependent dehydrogenase (short-subunit alcohol dehydrogenase family)
MELTKQTALITGGTAGIGLARARLTAREGASVIITGTDEQRGKEAAAGIEGDVHFIQADLSDIESVKSLAQQAGNADIQVNNAASSPAGLTVDQEVAPFEKTFDTNVRGTYFLAAGLVPGMLDRGRGSIVNVTTMVARAFPVHPPQCVASGSTASPRASFITGSTLHADGGGTAI